MTTSPVISPAAALETARNLGKPYRLTIHEQINAGKVFYLFYRAGIRVASTGDHRKLKSIIMHLMPTITTGEKR